ncbi:hypothetical protein SO802_009447 [Lithocarpus litseifolius]|uniref:Uncharacterized protein n=1 Tax=Lithocarpus litseifolius TaxID=425828 RepID=A0AAW2DFH2_9ROSI
MNGAGVPDFFCREAQRLGYVARSAFKMQKQYKLIKPGSSVLDLGCAPEDPIAKWLTASSPKDIPENKDVTIANNNVQSALEGSQREQSAV